MTIKELKKKFKTIAQFNNQFDTDCETWKHVYEVAKDNGYFMKSQPEEAIEVSNDDAVSSNAAAWLAVNSTESQPSEISFEEATKQHEAVIQHNREEVLEALRQANYDNSTVMPYKLKDKAVIFCSLFPNVVFLAEEAKNYMLDNGTLTKLLFTEKCMPHCRLLGTTKNGIPVLETITLQIAPLGDDTLSRITSIIARDIVYLLQTGCISFDVARAAWVKANMNRYGTVKAALQKLKATEESERLDAQSLVYRELIDSLTNG